ncbi:AMP-binding protein [Sciscionella marina]|uniref:AMP-binding protein n=1 Tax=Sciscionella marina TaxID=508770 RepID=UPI0012F66BBA|nr:AMP-binding protein [Sciscionella marina]
MTETTMEVSSEEDLTLTSLYAGSDKRPNAIMAVFGDGSRWTYRDGLRVARRAGDALVASGVGEGDHIGVLLPEGPAAVGARLGICMVGAALVSLDAGTAGRALARALQLAHPALVISTGTFIERIRAVDGPPILDVVELFGGR